MPGETKQKRRRKQNKSITVTSVGSKDMTQKQESSKINDIQISIASFFFKFIHLGLSLQVLSWGVPKKQLQSTEGNKEIGKREGEAGRVKELLSLNHANKAFWSGLRNREVVKRGGEWASSLHASKIHLKIGVEMKEIWSLRVSGRKRGSYCQLE